MCKDNINKPLCSYCKTGADSYKLDSHQPFCPFLSVYKDGMCIMFKGLSEYKNETKRNV